MDALRNRATSVTAGRAILRRDLPILAKSFKLNGYRASIFGKCHLGDNYPHRPIDRGFDNARDHRGFGLSSTPEFGSDSFNGHRHNGERATFGGHCSDFRFGEAMRWMRNWKARREAFSRKLPLRPRLPYRRLHHRQWRDSGV